jgi:hypothetical protein
MRLTETGDLGIGTAGARKRSSTSRARFRAERFLIAKPRLRTARDKPATRRKPPNAADSLLPLVAGNGTWNRLVRWMDDTGTLGDSAITQSSGNPRHWDHDSNSQFEIVLLQTTQANNQSQ